MLLFFPLPNPISELGCWVVPQMRDNGKISPSILGCFPQVSDGEEVSFVSGGCGRNLMQEYDCVAHLFPITSVSTLN